MTTIEQVREQILDVLAEHCHTHEHRNCECDLIDAQECWGALRDQILSLIQPLIDQAIKELPKTYQPLLEASYAEGKAEGKQEVIEMQNQALIGDLQDAQDHQHEFDKNPNWTEQMRAEHYNYWRGQAGAIAKILDVLQALKG